MIPATIAPRLIDDPAWVRYDFELRHLPLFAMRAAIIDTGTLIGEALAPVVVAMGRACGEILDAVGGAR